MPHSKQFLVLAAVVALTFGARAQESEPAADCTLSLKQMHFTERDVWRDLSRNAELVAPSRMQSDANSGARRRTVTPPKSPDAPVIPARNYIDIEIFAKMRTDGVIWTTLSSDEEFLRRVTLDLTGEIPDSATVNTFLTDTASDKRDKTIERLLASEAFNDRWTMWFGDLVQNVTNATNTTEYAPGRNAYAAFIRASIAADKPYDKMVRETLANPGRTFFNGETNYWVRQTQNNGPVQDTYDNLSASTGEKFLGLPLQCLSCHNGFGHLEQVNSGLAKRARVDFWKNAAFFAQVTISRKLDPATDSPETTLVDNTTGVYRLNTTSGNKTPRTAAPGAPAVADPAFFLGGDLPQAGETRRQAYARMLTAHPQFARNTVNRLWSELFGMGIVEPLDSFDLARQDPATLAAGATVQPTHPQLLTLLSNDFVAKGYSLRALLRTMVQSSAYQLSSRYTAGTWNESWTPYYARHYPHRLMAEELLDAVFRATGVGGSITVAQLPAPVTKAMALPDTIEGGSFRGFLNGFGRGDRDENGRTNDSSIVQALSLLNDRVVTDRIKATANGSTVQKLVRATTDPSTIAEGLYLATLSRYPTTAERAAAVTFLKAGDLTKQTEDLQFALLNKLEFLFN
ncbi:MAG: hypothetical protein JWO97_2936 [Acidobacteria bacterium]|nr:hypothetical protein [Acidobacteriota bacterium]